MQNSSCVDCLYAYRCLLYNCLAVVCCACRMVVWVFWLSHIKAAPVKTQGVSRETASWCCLVLCRTGVPNTQVHIGTGLMGT